MAKKKVADPPPPPVEEEDDDDEDEEEDYDEDDAVDHVPADDDEEEEEAPDGEQGADKLRRLKRSRVNARRKAVQNGLRAYATQAGAGLGSFGSDHAKTILAPSDVARLARWCPATPSDSFMSQSQFETHLTLRDQSLSGGPLSVLTTNVEAFARKVVTEVVMRNLESNGPQKITAANVRSVLRPYMGAFHMSAPLLPNGLARVAQTIAKNESEDTVLPASDETREAMAEERKAAKATQVKLLKEADKAIIAKKAARANGKRKRAGEEAAPAAAVAVA
jgi:hypothetical protein